MIIVRIWVFMSFIDVRSHISFGYINTLLLDVAQHPAHYSELVYRQVRVADGLHPSQDPMCSGIFVEISRQACAAIVLNCASELWSVLARCLLALEPSNQITEDVKKFLKETRIGNLTYFENYFKICGKKFRGTKPYDDLKLIYDIRNALAHDHPDYLNVEVEEQIGKWISCLQPRISDNDLKWLPRIPTLFPSDKPVPSLSSCIAVMNIMRYPVATWILEASKQIISELTQMMFNHKGLKRLVPQVVIRGVKFSDDLPLNQFLKIGGISVQIKKPSEDTSTESPEDNK